MESLDVPAHAGGVLAPEIAEVAIVLGVDDLVNVLDVPLDVGLVGAAVIAEVTAELGDPGILPAGKLQVSLEQGTEFEGSPAVRTHVLPKIDEITAGLARGFVALDHGHFEADL